MTYLKCHTITHIMRDLPAMWLNWSMYVSTKGNQSGNYHRAATGEPIQQNFFPVTVE